MSIIQTDILKSVLNLLSKMPKSYLFGKKSGSKTSSRDRKSRAPRRGIGRLSEEFKYSDRTKDSWEPWLDRLKLLANEKGIGRCFDEKLLAKAKVEPPNPY